MVDVGSRRKRHPGEASLGAVFRTPDGQQLATHTVIWDIVGGGMTWKSPEYNALHPVDPYLFELGWRAWLWLVEELTGSSALTAPEFAALLARANENVVAL